MNEKEDLIDVEYESIHIWNFLLQQNRLFNQFERIPFGCHFTFQTKRGVSQPVLPDIISFFNDGSYVFNIMAAGLLEELNLYLVKTLEKLAARSRFFTGCDTQLLVNHAIEPVVPIEKSYLLDTKELKLAIARPSQLVVRKSPSPACLAYVLLSLRCYDNNACVLLEKEVVLDAEENRGNS